MRKIVTEWRSAANGTKLCWRLDGGLHRDGDLPAVVDVYGFLEWWYENKRHRNNNKPAIINKNMRELEWWVHGKRHHDDDKPAVTRRDRVEWWQNGLRHRAGSKPAVISASGARDWWVVGLRHRDNNKPAMIEADGTLQWWTQGILSRVIRTHGSEDTFDNIGRLVQTTHLTNFSPISDRFVFLVTCVK